MKRGVGEHLWTQLLGDQTRQSFGQPHPHASDALGAQAYGRGEHEARAIGLEQVHGTDVRPEPPLNQVDDVAERLGGVAALRHQPADFFERPEKGTLVETDAGAGHVHENGSEQESCPGPQRKRADFTGIAQANANICVDALERTTVLSVRARRGRIADGRSVCKQFERIRIRVCAWIVGCYDDRRERTAPMADPLNEEATVEFHALVERARGEFLEMPGLRLTIPQAARLWGLDTDSCSRIIETLVGSSFLRWTPDGNVARVDRGIL